MTDIRSEYENLLRCFRNDAPEGNASGAEADGFDLLFLASDPEAHRKSGLSFHFGAGRKQQVRDAEWRRSLREDYALVRRQRELLDHAGARLALLLEMTGAEGAAQLCRRLLGSDGGAFLASYREMLVRLRRAAVDPEAFLASMTLQEKKPRIFDRPEAHHSAQVNRRDSLLTVYGNMLAAGILYSLGLRADGTVLAAGTSLSGQCEVSGRKDVVAVAAGYFHSLGLKADGTVFAAGENNRGQCEVSRWKNIVAIAAGRYHSLGLREDGAVLAVGCNTSGQCEVSGWKDVVAIAAGRCYSLGLRMDGAILTAGSNTYGQIEVSGWENVVAIAAGRCYSLGLQADGTVLAAGDNEHGQCEVSHWKNVVAIAAGFYHSLGLQADGTVLAAGDNGYSQCEVFGWKNVVAIAAGAYHSLGLRADGTVLATGDNIKNISGNCELSHRKLFGDADFDRSYRNARLLLSKGNHLQAAEKLESICVYRDSARLAALARRRAEKN